MAVIFTVKIVSEDGESCGNFVASSNDVSGTDTIFAGHSKTPYEALHDLINELENAELYRPDEPLLSERREDEQIQRST